jgi:putative ATPase
VRNGPARTVPAHLRDRHRPGSEEYPAYRYPHAHPDGWVDQAYLPDGLESRSFYEPGTRGWEAEREEKRPRRDRPDDAEEPS